MCVGKLSFKFWLLKFWQFLFVYKFQWRYDNIDYICLDDIKKLVYLLYKIKNNHNQDINMIYVHKYIFYILRMYPLNYYNNPEKPKFIKHNDSSYILIKCNESSD